MNGLACLKCHKFFRVEKCGVAIEEGRPVTTTEWGPYKLYVCDIGVCPGCGARIAFGFSQCVSEHYMHDYAITRERLGWHNEVICINDCGGLSPK